MKHDNRVEARRAAAARLTRAGVDMRRGVYDNRADGRRYSVFRGQVTAIWDDAHFTKYPFGTWPVVEAA